MIVTNSLVYILGLLFIMAISVHSLIRFSNLWQKDFFDWFFACMAGCGILIFIFGIIAIILRPI